MATRNAQGVFCTRYMYFMKTGPYLCPKAPREVQPINHGRLVKHVLCVAAPFKDTQIKRLHERMINLDYRRRRNGTGGGRARGGGRASRQCGASCAGSRSSSRCSSNLGRSSGNTIACGSGSSGG